MVSHVLLVKTNLINLPQETAPATAEAETYKICAQIVMY